MRSHELADELLVTAADRDLLPPDEKLDFEVLRTTEKPATTEEAMTPGDRGSLRGFVPDSLTLRSSRFVALFRASNA
jgi:hypothetical protein